MERGCSLFLFASERSTKLIANNRHAQFFKNLVEARRTNEGRKAIEEYALF